MFKSKKVLTKNSVLNIPDIENRVFSFYIPEFRQGNRLFKSVFRDEKDASSNIVKYNNTLFYKDFGEEKAMNIISFVMRLKCCDSNTALSHINDDLGLGFHSSGCTKRVTTMPLGLATDGSVVTVLKIKKRSFNDEDIKYWGQYNITIEHLKEYNIHAISHFEITKGGKSNVILADKLAYSFDYYVNEGVFRRKIYQPKSKIKWISNIDNTVVQGIKNIPINGQRIVISKGMKDTIVWNKVLGIPSVSANSEAAFIPDIVIEKLRKRFNEVYINFDNDKTGLRQSSKYATKYNLKIVEIPKIIGVKDISDLVKYNFNLACELKNNVLNNEIKNMGDYDNFN